jgi:hypothetical protein
MAKNRKAYRILPEKPEGKDHYEDPDVYGRIILEWNLESIG